MNRATPSITASPAPGNEERASRSAAPRSLLRALAGDERGGEVIEYVLIAGLIIVGTIAVIGLFGTKVVARWTSVGNGSL